MRRTVFIAGSRITLPDCEGGEGARSEPFVMSYDEFRQIGIVAGWIHPTVPRSDLPGRTGCGLG